MSLTKIHVDFEWKALDLLAFNKGERAASV
jgi:hypothetical protein